MLNKVAYNNRVNSDSKKRRSLSLTMLLAAGDLRRYVSKARALPQ